MSDRILAALSLALLLAFLGVLVGFVPELDLAAVVVVVGLMAGYDFYLSLRRK